MNPYLIPLGKGQVYRDARNGATIVDTDSIARGGFAGEEPAMEPGPEYGMEDPDGAQYAGEVPGMPYDDTFGATRYPARYPGYPFPGYPAPRAPQPYRPPAPRPAPVQAVQRADKNHDKVPDGWVSTFLVGSVTRSEGGQASITIRTQHHFVATDVTFEGSANGTTVSQVMFGSRPVVNVNDGIPVSIFTPTSQMRKYLEGQTIRAGLDIVVNGNLTGAGTFSVVFFGYKPPEN